MNTSITARFPSMKGDYAYENGLIVEDGVVYRNLFDNKIMLMPRPSEVIRRFRVVFWFLRNRPGKA